MGVKYKSFTSKRKFGVEFELSNDLNLVALSKAVEKISSKSVYKDDCWAATCNDNNFWHIKRDSTCGPEGKTKNISKYGYEIASYVGKGINDILHIGDVADSLRKSGAVINDNCGMHIHASGDNISLEQIGIVMAYWLKIERIIFQSCPSHRRKNKYCRTLKGKVLSSHNLTSIEFWEKIKPQNLAVHENNDKKVSLNSVGYAAAISGHYNVKNTLELRVPEASLEKEDVINWVKLYLNFIETVLCAKMPMSSCAVGVKQTLQILGLEGVQNFFILSKGLFKTKIWFLNRIIKYSNLKGLVNEAKYILKDISTL